MNEYTFKVINPKKPKLIFPGMFDVLLFILWIFFVVMAALNADNPNSIYAKIMVFYLSLVEINSVLGFLAFAITVFIPVVIGKILFNRYLLKIYLSTANVKLYDDHITVDFINSDEKYCSQKTLYLNELKSYGISRATTIVRYSKNSGLINNMGILLITNSEKIVFRLIDNYSLLPSLDKFNDIENMVRFSGALKKYIDNYNSNNINNNIKFHVPVKWRYIPRLFLTISALLCAVILILWIFVYIVK
ncbi:MAG: hypothetical protein BWY74_04121 [Firmicutes bacterium ADurb.Bin419]|nr:MAG: hypothetical protein BWY74_04121 [Firmicutes bacterium ADurb.Bin419]